MNNKDINDDDVDYWQASLQFVYASQLHQQLIAVAARSLGDVSALNRTVVTIEVLDELESGVKAKLIELGISPN